MEPLDVLPLQKVSGSGCPHCSIKKAYLIWWDFHVSSQALNLPVLKQNLGPEGQRGYFTSWDAFSQATLTFCSFSALR